MLVVRSFRETDILNTGGWKSQGETVSKKSRTKTFHLGKCEIKESESVLLAQEHCKVKHIQKKMSAALGNVDDNAGNNRFWNNVDTTLNFKPKTAKVRNQQAEGSREI